jgi:hypothetical protein
MVRACVKSCNGRAIVGRRDPADLASVLPGRIKHRQQEIALWIILFYCFASCG